MTSKIEISHKTILFTLLVLVAIWLFIEIRDILFLLFISFILMCALRPFVDWLEKLRLPRVIAILFVYTVVFGIIGLTVASVIPSLVVQSGKLVQELPVFMSKVLPYWGSDLRTLPQQIAPIGENLVKVTLGIFSNIITTLTVLVFTFYLLLEQKRIEAMLEDLTDSDTAKKVLTVARKIEVRLGAWVIGEIVLMMTIGILSYVGLTLLHIDFALPLAIFAGILEVVPTIGPIVSAIPAILVALATSPFLALTVVALYFIIQQAENNLIVPLVMKQSVGMSPLITILSVMVGARLAGVTGAVLAIPVVLVLQEVIAAVFSESPKAK